MLGFERRVVEVLVTATDPTVRAAVLDWVESSLAAMPEHLRAGVLLESVAFAATAAVTGRLTADLVERLAASPIAPVRQYVRLLRSLVLFAEHEHLVRLATEDLAAAEVPVTA